MGISLGLTSEALVVATAAPVPVRKPVWRLVVDGKDVSLEISPSVLSVTYMDHAHGKSDEIEVKLENRDHKWSNAWYPSKGDAVELMIGYAGEDLLPCGRFEIDKVTLEGPPDVVGIKCLAAGIIPALRTKRSAGFDGQLLGDIVAKVAARHGYTVLGEIAPLRIARVTQHQETDVSFLARVAEQYGYVFSIRPPQLIFYRRATLEGAGVVWTLKRGQAKRYKFDDETRTLYRACTVSYDDPVTGRTLSRTVSDPNVRKGDVHKITARVENAEQADAQARAALHYVNSSNAKSTVVLPGNPRLVGGATVAVEGFGVSDGTYLVQTARHRITREPGYEVELEMTRA